MKYLVFKLNFRSQKLMRKLKGIFPFYSTIDHVLVSFVFTNYNTQMQPSIVVLQNKKKISKIPEKHSCWNLLLRMKSTPTVAPLGVF